MTAHPFQEGRRAGVLLHITSLPGRYGSGDIGIAAREFARLLGAGGQRFWQVLPLNPPATHAGFSPYDSLSAFAGNPLLISPEDLATDGWIDTADLPAPLPSGPRADFKAALSIREHLFDLAFAHFTSSGHNEEFTAFCRRECDWIQDYALFRVISTSERELPWTEWPAGLRDRDPAALESFLRMHHAEVLREEFIQFLFSQQWSRFHQHCRENGVALMGDLPIFVSHNSADVWTHRSLFCLDRRGMPEVVAGVPPDYFSRTGQRWGNPLYRWELHEEDDFAWWRSRIRTALSRTDLLRIDHFRGFSACFAISAASLTAERGNWEPVPGRELFSSLQGEFPTMPFIAEDLGIIDEDVRELMARFGLPGMNVLLFAFGGGSGNPYLPHNYVPDSVVYTGTHDNTTARGWLQENEGTAAHRHLEAYSGCTVTAGNIHQVLLRLAYLSVSRAAIIPLQDLLGLGPEARMNTPGTQDGNWEWRLIPSQAGEELFTSLKHLAELAGRLPSSHPGSRP